GGFVAGVRLRVHPKSKLAQTAGVSSLVDQSQWGTQRDRGDRRGRGVEMQQVYHEMDGRGREMEREGMRRAPTLRERERDRERERHVQSARGPRRMPISPGHTAYKAYGFNKSRFEGRVLAQSPQIGSGPSGKLYHYSPTYSLAETGAMPKRRKGKGRRRSLHQPPVPMRGSVLRERREQRSVGGGVMGQRQSRPRSQSVVTRPRSSGGPWSSGR
ncbi:hypothetical protein KIPB_010533, partial [Kipferlia bialata]